MTYRTFGLMLIAFLGTSELALAQQLRFRAADDDLVELRSAISPPSRRAHLSVLGEEAVQTGDTTTQTVREIAVSSFAAQQAFAERMNKSELINSKAIVALPEVDDEVLEFDDAFVVRRSTKVIVSDPRRVARESELFRSYIGSPSRRATTRAPALTDEERTGLQEFMANGVTQLHANDPLRAAAAAGEAELLDAIASGQGELVVEDTLIIPKVAGLDMGSRPAIPAIRNGVLDLSRPEPLKMLQLTAVETNNTAAAIQSIPAKPADRPARAPLQPTAKASGKHTFNAEFLMGMTRASNFQWERKWTFPSGYFRLTVGAGYALGYRVPMLATATVEPTKGYIRDYSDKRATFGASATLRTLDAGADFYRRAGLEGNQVQGGNELLLEANVGWGYKFRALWRDIRHRPYTAVGVAYTQSFTPPANGLDTTREFALMLDPAQTKMSIEGKFVGGTMTVRLAGAASGAARIQLDTLVDNKRQQSFAITPDKMLQAGALPYRMTLDPLPLRHGATMQTRSFGVRLTKPVYKGRVIIQPAVQFGFKVGYKRIKREFKSGWIAFNELKIDTGNATWPVHAGTRAQATWNGGEKIFVKLEKPADRTRLTTAPKVINPSKIQLPEH